MASAFSHALVAVVLGKAFALKDVPPRIWVLAAGCSILPDADVIGFAFGIRYHHWLGHRGFSHSLFFALLLSLFIVFLSFRGVAKTARQRWGLICFFFLATASHGFLDALTDGGLGVAFFAPFDTTRYFFPWRPVEVSPIGVGAFFSEWGVRVIISELLWIWLPSLLFLGGVLLWQKARAKK